MRYEIKQRVMDNGWVIWDTKLSRFIGDGKEQMLTRPTMGQIITVVADLRQRVGA